MKYFSKILWIFIPFLILFVYMFVTKMQLLALVGIGVIIVIALVGIQGCSERKNPSQLDKKKINNLEEDLF